MTANWLVPEPSTVSRRTATRVTLGAISLSNSSHFPPILNSKFINPVTLPPGRAKLATYPAPTGSPRIGNTIGTVRETCSKVPTGPAPWARITSGASATNSSACLRNLCGIGRGPAGVDPHVAADVPARLTQRLQERSDPRLISRVVRDCGQEHADAPHPLLRARGERPPGRRATQTTEEFPPPHASPQAQEPTSYRQKRVC